MATHPSKKKKIVQGPPKLFGKAASRETVDSLGEKFSSMQSDIEKIKNDLRDLRERVDSLSED